MRSAGYLSKTKTSFALLTSDRLLLCSCAAWYFAARSSASCLEREYAVQGPRTGEEDSGTFRQDRIGLQRCRNKTRVVSESRGKRSC
jgi:hypothetical protein